MMNSQDGPALEKAGNFDLAQAFYQTEIVESRVTKEAVRGLFRTTMRVGDIVSLVSTLPELSQLAGINDDSANLMQSRLLIEIGEVEKAKNIINEIDSKFLGLPEISELDLLKANILASQFEFQDALDLLNQSSDFSIGILRRVAELELALQKPTESIAALKRYVSELNIRNKNNGNTKRFITANGNIFNLANQIWLEQKFPDESQRKLSLSQSMKVLVDYCKSAPEEISYVTSGRANQDLDQNITYEQSLIQPKPELVQPKFSNKLSIHVNSLIEFTKVAPSDREYSIGPAREWEDNNCLANNHFFAIEESGLAIATNFGICSMCKFVPQWHIDLLESKAAGRKGHLPHLSPAGSLTRYLAEIIQNSSNHIPAIAHRSKLRAARSLPYRYSL
jgi:hypothetical protein